MDRDLNLGVQASRWAFKLLNVNAFCPVWAKNSCLFSCEYFCYVLQLSMEHTNSVFTVSVLCVLVLPFVLGNYVGVVRWFLCPGCLAPCKSQVLLLLQVHDKCRIHCLVFHDGLIVSVFVIVWVRVVPMGTLYCPSVTWTFLPWDMTCYMFVCCSF